MEKLETHLKSKGFRLVDKFFYSMNTPMGKLMGERKIYFKRIMNESLYFITSFESGAKIELIASEFPYVVKISFSKDLMNSGKVKLYKRNSLESFIMKLFTKDELRINYRVRLNNKYLIDMFSKRKWLDFLLEKEMDLRTNSKNQLVIIPNYSITKLFQVEELLNFCNHLICVISKGRN